MSKIKPDVLHWISRAKDARATAAHVNNPEAKRIVLEIAEGCEQLARCAAETKVRKRP